VIATEEVETLGLQGVTTELPTDDGTVALGRRAREQPLRRDAARWGATVALLCAGLFLLWPARFGGRAAFVVVQGNSMEPAFHSGDLLYARRSGGYRVGDVVVYRAERGGMVVHRIRSVTADGRYVLRGDNRTNDDGGSPTADDVVARVAANLGAWPMRALGWTPTLMGLLCAFALGWYLWPASANDEAPPTRVRRTPDPRRRALQTAGSVVALAAVAGTAIVVVPVLADRRHAGVASSSTDTAARVPVSPGADMTLPSWVPVDTAPQWQPVPAELSAAVVVSAQTEQPENLADSVPGWTRSEEKDAQSHLLATWTPHQDPTPTWRRAREQ